MSKQADLLRVHTEPFGEGGLGQPQTNEELLAEQLAGLRSPVAMGFVFRNTSDHTLVYVIAAPPGCAHIDEGHVLLYAEPLPKGAGAALGPHCERTIDWDPSDEPHHVVVDEGNDSYEWNYSDVLLHEAEALVFDGAALLVHTRAGETRRYADCD